MPVVAPDVIVGLHGAPPVAVAVAVLVSVSSEPVSVAVTTSVSVSVVGSTEGNSVTVRVTTTVDGSPSIVVVRVVVMIWEDSSSVVVCTSVSVGAAEALVAVTPVNVSVEPKAGCLGSILGVLTSNALTLEARDTATASKIWGTADSIGRAVANSTTAVGTIWTAGHMANHGIWHVGAVCPLLAALIWRPHITATIHARGTR